MFSARGLSATRLASACIDAFNALLFSLVNVPVCLICAFICMNARPESGRYCSAALPASVVAVPVAMTSLAPSCSSAGRVCKNAISSSWLVASIFLKVLRICESFII